VFAASAHWSPRLITYLRIKGMFTYVVTTATMDAMEHATRSEVYNNVIRSFK